MKLFLVIRIRGTMGLAPDVVDTLNRLNMPKNHTAVLLTDTPSNEGMLRKVADYVTWGEITPASMEALLERRGRLPGDKRLTSDEIGKLGLGSLKEIAEHAMNGELPEPIKHTFRLTPPSGGFKKSIKRHIRSGGELGYRGDSINELLEKML